MSADINIYIYMYVQLLVVSANPSFHQNFTFQLGSSTITPSETARNLGVVFDDKLNFTEHITKTARSCRFALYNIKKISPFLSEHATSNSSSLYSNFILSNLSSFYLKKHTHLTLYQLQIYSLTASFSCKTNTRFLFSIFYILVFLIKKKQHVLRSANQDL